MMINLKLILAILGRELIQKETFMMFIMKISWVSELLMTKHGGKLWIRTNLTHFIRV